MDKAVIKGKGDVVLKSGVTINEYVKVHRWISKMKGKAYKCENQNCDGLSVNYHHSLKKGKRYEKDVENFWMLCVKCHKKYDWKDEFANHVRGMKLSDETKAKLAAANLGKKASDETKRKLSERFSGSNNPMYGVSISGEKSAWWGRKHTENSKIKQAISSAKVSEEVVIEIRRLVDSGVRQKEVAKQVGLSRASICRIVNKKRYKQW